MAGEPYAGSTPTAALNPSQFPVIDAPTYAVNMAKELAQNIQAQAYQGKTAIGMPASWYAMGYGDIIPAQSLNSDGSPDSWLSTRLLNWAITAGANDLEAQQTIMGAPMPKSSGGDFANTPLTPEQALAIRKQDFAEAQALAKAAAQAVGGTVVRPPSSSTLGQATSQSRLTQQLMDTLRGTPVSANVQAYDPEVALQAQLAQGRLNLDNLIFEADKAYKQASLAQNQSQFQSTLDYQKQRDAQQFGLDRATTISKFAADPGDAVAREYFLRAQGQQPTGTPVDIFTGQPGSTPTTQAELAAAQAPLLAPYAQAAGSNAPVVPALAPETPPPGMAFGTEDGWTRAPKFIAGDPQVPGRVNPELIQLRVKNGEPQAKVTPLSQVVGQAPRYAIGTEPDVQYYGGYRYVNGIPDDPQAPVYPSAQVGTTAPTQPAPIGAGSLLFNPVNNNGVTSITATPAPPSTYTAPKTTIAPVVAPPPPSPTYSPPPSVAPVAAPAVTTQPPIAPVVSTPTGTVSKTSALSSILGNPGTIPLPGMPAPPAPPVPPVAPTISPNDAYIAQYYGISPTDTRALASARVQAAIEGIPLPQDTPEEAAAKAERARIAATQPLLTPDALQAEANFNPNMAMELGVAGGGVQMIDPTKAGYVTSQQYYNPSLPVGLRTTPTGAPATYTGPMASGVGTNEYQPGLRGSLTTPEPPAPGTNPLVRTTYEPGMEPAGTPATQGSPTVMGGIAVSAPQAGGYRIVGQNGTYTTPDGGGTVTVQAGDRIGPDGTPYRFNTATNTWGVAPVVATKVTSLQQFYGLPVDVRNKILSGQPTNYVLGDNRQNDWVASLLNPQQMTFPGTPDAAGIYPAGTLPPGQGYTQMNPVNEPAQPVARGVGGAFSDISVAPGVSGVAGSAGWRLRPNPTIGPPLPDYTGTFGAAPGAGDQAYVDYVGQQGKVWQAEDARAAAAAKIQSEIVQNQYRQAMGLPPIPGTAYQPLPPGTPGLPPGQGGSIPGQGYAVAPPAPMTPPGQGGTPPGQGGPIPGGAVTPPRPGMGGISTLSYGPEAYHNLPLMRYLRGEITHGQFNTIASQPIEVPALGLTGSKALPAISALNYGKLLNLKRTDPDGYSLLDSMYRAANVGSLDSILAYHRSIAPLGTAYEASLIET